MKSVNVFELIKEDFFSFLINTSWSERLIVQALLCFIDFFIVSWKNRRPVFLQ